ncbi:MAG: c-type cytochrome biogenesis protein CcsB [Deltaproteobacteria bacterium]|jgi:cytochrome c-type biogenesis protein CcsB|nr:c-type cytochrome biogenesis protein CcsB [Deltaproteobacteria bacterium]MBW2534362.1 c-type cytochrome biogenesis protein CcsB [Deltaproteobacteria bacterium]
MIGVEIVLNWVAASCYAITTVLVVYLAAFGRKRGERTALWITSVGVATHLVALVLRMIQSGHIPVDGDYENASAAAIFISIPAALIAWRKPALRLMALAAIPLALFVLGYGLLHFDEATPLSPMLKSSWLVYHVVFANISYGAFSLACGAGIVYLVKERRLRLGRELKLLEKLPDLDDLDDYIFRFVVFGFTSCAMMIVAGAFWADQLWGSYWSWDPVETWSLISWVIYGLFIHFRVVHHWRGRRLAWLAVIAIVTVLMSFWGVNMLRGSFHIFKEL